METPFADITLDGDVADRIATEVLKQHREYMKLELDAFKKGDRTIHPEDVANYLKCIEATDYLLGNYFTA